MCVCVCVCVCASVPVSNNTMTAYHWCVYPLPFFVACMLGVNSSFFHMRQPTQITLGDAELSVPHHRLVQVQCHITAVGIPEPNKGHLRWCLQRAHFAAGQENKQRTGPVHLRQQRTSIVPFQLGNSIGKIACARVFYTIPQNKPPIGCSWCARHICAPSSRLGKTHAIIKR